MSIRFRLNAVMVALMLVALVAAVGSLIMSAGPRINAEHDSIVRLSKEFVETAIESLQGTKNPGDRLVVLLQGLKGLRHVKIYRADEPLDPAAAAAVQSPEGEAPEWLTQLADPAPTLQIPVIVNGESFGELVVAPQAADESAEIWDSIVKFSVVGTALAAATLLLTSIMIAHMLRPIRTVGDALIALDGGNYDVAVTESGPPEIADICKKLNRLAETLRTTTADNRRLAERIIYIQDEERKDLARELHDELGPYLFAIRVGAGTIRKEAERGACDRLKLVQGCDTLLERIETMQSMNRRVLQKLRPMGLDEFGLKAKLASLVGMWRENHPDVDITLSFADTNPERDETSNLTIYRVVQEGVTNAFRHSEATKVAIVVEPAAATPARAQRQGGRPSVHVTVSDNGRGLGESARPNYGITGMTERVLATGGEIRIVNREGGGTMLEAWVPASTEGAGRDDATRLSGA